MFKRFGDDAYTNGYRITTTIDSRLQLLSEKSLRLGLHDYDERHGYRGPQSRIDLNKVRSEAEWNKELSSLKAIGETIPGVVLSVKKASADIYIGSSQHLTLNWKGIRWARRYINENRRGPAPRRTKDVLKPGDIIRVRKNDDGIWMLSQIPEVGGALASLDPKDGRVIALAGGYDFEFSKFNRATQAQRQPGSGFKPILYAAALTEGYTPSSIVNDAPIVYADASQRGGIWRPKNYSGRYYGPTRLRIALAKSRNLVSIRLLKSIGLPKAIATAEAFGFLPEELPKSLPLALGTGSATPLRMAQAYSVFANGGFRVDPYFIERVETADGKVVFQASPPTACLQCVGSTDSVQSLAKRIISPQVHYMMHSMLQDVIRIGTATRALKLGRSDIAGKTGTTNDYRDAWFNGYSPSLVTIAWLGFDSSKSLGHGETGGHSALPIWMRFMEKALRDVPEFTFPLPTGLTTTRIDPYTGARVSASSANAIFEVTPSGGQAPRTLSARKTRRRIHREPVHDDGTNQEDSPPPSGNRALSPVGRPPPPAQKSLETLF